MKFAKVFDTADGGQVLYYMHTGEERKLMLSAMSCYEGVDATLSFSYGDEDDSSGGAARESYFNKLSQEDAEKFRTNVKKHFLSSY